MDRFIQDVFLSLSPRNSAPLPSATRTPLERLSRFLSSERLTPQHVPCPHSDLTVYSSVILQLSQLCHQVRIINLAGCILHFDVLIQETGEYLSRCEYQPQDYLTHIALDPMRELEDACKRLKNLIMLDLRGCSWVSEECLYRITKLNMPAFRVSNIFDLGLEYSWS